MIVGTAGHIDHGKTALVRALTGVETDRLKEEKTRGITIELGFAYLPRPDGRTIGFVDVPGHERFVGTMLAGAHGIDFVLLVIAATEGVMPQTREHLEILDLLGLRRGLVVLSKADLVDDDTLLLRELEIIEALAGSSLAGASVLPVSAVTGRGVPALLDRLDQEALGLAPRDSERAFRLAVDRSFTLTGAGTVVTGTVLDGQIAAGDAVVVSPAGLEARVRSLHVQNRPASHARAGDRAALNLAGVTKEDVTRGAMVLVPSLHAPTRQIDAALRLAPAEAGWPAQGMPVRLHHASAEVGARVIRLDEPPPPGGSADIQLVLEHPLAVVARDRFVLRDVSQRRTIGGGILLDPHPPHRRRRSEERAAIRAAWREAEPKAAIECLLALPPFTLPLGRLLADHGLPPSSGPALVQALDAVTLRVAGTDHIVLRSSLQALGVAAAEALEPWHRDNPDHAGMSLDRLRVAVARAMTMPVFRAVATWARDRGVVVIDGGWVRLPGHSVAITAEDEAGWASIVPLLSGDARFHPPRVRDIACALARDEADVRALLRRLRRTSRVDEIARDHYFARATTAELVRILVALSATEPTGWFTAAAYRDRLGNGRKVAIQILEFMDRHGVTIRRGDLRRPNPSQVDLFSAP